MIVSALDELIDRLEDAANRHDLDAGLGELVRFVGEVNALPDVAGLVYESRELDAACARLACILREDGGPGPEPPFPVEASTQVYLATTLYATGGHSGVVRDFIRSQPDARHLVLLTDLHRNSDRPRLEVEFSAPNVALLWMDGTTPAERARHTLAMLRQCREGRLFLFAHAEDAVAMAAAMASEHPRAWFCHHCDHSLALGLHAPGFGHIDFSSFAYHQCRGSLGVARGLYLPLTSSGGEAREPADFTAGPGDPAFVTCCAGNGGKFQRPYAYAYPELVAEILGRTAGRHVHIGDLKPDFVAGVGAALEEAGIAPGRFVHVPSVPDLGAAMRDHAVSLYLGSFPIGGAKGLVDVMASGTPILGHRHVTSEFLGGQCNIYPEAPLWTFPRELFARIMEFDPSRLGAHSRLARAFWESHHAPGTLVAALGGRDVAEPVPPPDFSAPPVDPLRALLADPARHGQVTANLSQTARLERKLSKSEGRNAKLAAKVEQLELRCRNLRGELDAARRSKLWKFLASFRQKSG